MKRSLTLVVVLISMLILSACGGASATTAPTAGPTTVAPTTASGPATAAPANATAESTEDIVIEPANPTAPATQPVIKGTPPASGGQINGKGTPIPLGTKPAINPPTTLDDLLKLYPDLKPYIDSVAAKTQLTDQDLADLYKQIIKIYKDKGASGVAAFLKDSGILDKLNIPLSYLDLLTAFGDNADFAAVEKLARQRRLISDKNEVVGYLGLDAKDNLASVTTDLKNLGVSVYSYDDNLGEVEIGIPLAILSQKQTPGLLLSYLNNIAHVNHVISWRPPTPKSTTTVDWQKFATQGAATIGADKWQKAGITGKGVKIGILDMGFGGVSDRVGKELPPADQIESNVPLDELTQQDEDHGTACAMIVHGAAPDAQIFLAQFDGTSQDSFLAAVQFLVDSKVQIINYSVGSSIGPRDGTFGEAVFVNDFVNQTGILWVNAAGNEAVDHTAFQYQDNGQGVHQFSSDVTALPFVPFAPITTVTMNWNGNWNGKEKAEYDFRVVDADGNEVVTADEPRKGRKNDLPFQIASFESTPKSVYYLVFHKERGTEDNILDVFIPNAVLPDWAQVPDHSVTTPGDAAGAFTVGATGLADDTLEFYSSQGPTNDDRLKPDVTAPTGEILPGHEDGFAGTSGAAPLAAGAAGLVLQKYPDMKAEEVKAFLTTNVKDLGDQGPDPLYGAGRIALPDPGKLNADDPGNTDSTPVPDSSGPVATITNIDTQYNVKVKGQKGLVVTVSFEVDNFKGKNGIIAVLFFDKNGKQIPSKNKTYTIGKGLGTGLTFTPKYDQTAYDSVPLFIPNSAIGSSVKEMYFIVGILDADNPDTPLAVSDKASIRVK